MSLWVWALSSARPLFDQDEVVEGPRLRLSHLSAEALVPMAEWLEAALAPDWRLDDLRTAVEEGGAASIADASGEAIGVAVALIGAPALKAAAVPFLAVAPQRRYRGLGGEAGLALERHLRVARGVETVYAPVTDGRGLAVYFWLRLGYRPLSFAEGPDKLLGLAAEPRPGIWMVRDRD